jgi:hypothetical protein
MPAVALAAPLKKSLRLCMDGLPVDFCDSKTARPVYRPNQAGSGRRAADVCGSLPQAGR